MEAAFIPEVKNELDTQNFEIFDEVKKRLEIFTLCDLFIPRIFQLLTLDHYKHVRKLVELLFPYIGFFQSR